MRQDDQPRLVEQGILRVAQRLGGEDVEPGGVQPALAQRREQRRLVDDAAAGGRHQRPPRPDQVELARPDQAGGLGSPRHVQRDDVRALEQLVERRRRRDPVVGTRRATVLEHGHPEALAAARDGLADLAVADDPERGAGDVEPEEVARVEGAPRAAPHDVGGLDEPPAGHQDQPEGDVGGRIRQDPRGVGDDHAVTRRGLQIDVVEADRDERDDLQSRRGGEQRLVDLVGGRHDERVGVRDQLAQRGRVRLDARRRGHELGVRRQRRVVQSGVAEARQGDPRSGRGDGHRRPQFCAPPMPSRASA